MTAGLRDVVLAVHHLRVGHDRARRYDAGLQDAARGGVVIFDRFPVTCMSADPAHCVLDGPQIAAVLGQSPNPFVRTLAAREARLYRRFAPPDVLVVLVADTQVASARKPDHDPMSIAAKRRAAIEISDLAATRDVRVVRIDANRPFPGVLLATKVGVWDAL